MSETIIDGVDVSECMYYSKKQQIYSATKPLCKMKDCCMLSDSVSLCLEKDCYYKQLQRLKEEFKRLKESECKICKYFNIDDKYKQTLQEIRYICKMDCGDCEHNQDCDCNFSECEESKIDEIIDKINSVIGAE